MEVISGCWGGRGTTVGRGGLWCLSWAREGVLGACAWDSAGMYYGRGLGEWRYAVVTPGGVDASVVGGASMEEHEFGRADETLRLPLARRERYWSKVGAQRELAGMARGLSLGLLGVVSTTKTR